MIKTDLTSDLRNEEIYRLWRYGGVAAHRIAWAMCVSDNAIIAALQAAQRKRGEADC